MEAPGIKHSAKCKRKREEFDRQNREQDTNMEENPEPTSNSRARVATEVESAVPNPPSFPTEITAADVRGQKRESEQPAEELEAEIKDGHDDMELDSVGLDLNWSSNGDPILSPIQLEVYGQKVPATAPEFFDDLISSIKFAPDKKHTFFKMTLGGSQVLVWKPDALVDDSSLMTLDTEQGFEGMKEEIKNLEHCKTGKVISQTELEQLKRKNPHLRLIPSRWELLPTNLQRVCVHASWPRT